MNILYTITVTETWTGKVVGLYETHDHVDASRAHRNAKAKAVARGGKDVHLVTFTSKVDHRS